MEDASSVSILGAALHSTFSMANTLEVLLSSTKSLVSLPAGEAVHHSWGLHFYVKVVANGFYHSQVCKPQG